MASVVVQTEKARTTPLPEWSVPVRIQVGYGFPELVHGPEEALDVLQHRWPKHDGKHYRDALSHCRAAVHRLVPVAKAREVFVAASIEANMLAR